MLVCWVCGRIAPMGQFLPLCTEHTPVPRRPVEPRAPLLPLVDEPPC